MRLLSAQANEERRGGILYAFRRRAVFVDRLWSTLFVIGGSTSRRRLIAAPKAAAVLAALLVLQRLPAPAAPGAGVARGQEQLTLAGVKATRVPWCADAMLAAAQDAAALEEQLGRGAASGCLYVFLPQPSKEATAGYVYSLNCSISQASTPLIPTSAYGGHLLRISLPDWCGDEAGLTRVLKTLTTYEDPYLYVEDKALVTVPEYKANDGKKYTTALRTVRQFAPHIDQAAAASLKEMTGLDMPLVYGPRWLGLSLGTLNGGIYYKLRGYDKLNLKQWFALFGASQAASDALDGDSFVGIFRSGVTGSPRRAVGFFGVAVRPAHGIPFVGVTQDIKKGKIDPARHPGYSLLDFEFDASEAIAVLPNGFPAAFLANGAGERADFVPPDIAADHTVPPSYGTNQLQPLISCGTCHASDDFWKPCPNNIARLLKLREAGGALRFDVFADFGATKKGLSQKEIFDKLRGKYSGDLEDALVLARNAMERAAFKATGMGTADCWKAIGAEWQAHEYDEVTARRACLELGWRLDDGCSEAEAAEAFAALVGVLPPIPGTRPPLHPENPVIHALKDYADEELDRIKVTRADWDHVFRDAALRGKDNSRARLSRPPK